MLKNKDFKTIFCSAGNQCYQRKVVPQVNLVIPPVVNRFISVRELRAVAIKHLVELSVEHEIFCHIFSKRKTCLGTCSVSLTLCCFVVYSTRRSVVCLSVCHFVLVFFSPFSIAITSLGEKRANLSAFRMFVRFVFV